jgi:DNA polymerase-3 subunit gamma/tau
VRGIPGPDGELAVTLPDPFPPEPPVPDPLPEPGPAPIPDPQPVRAIRRGEEAR